MKKFTITIKEIFEILTEAVNDYNRNILAAPLFKKRYSDKVCCEVFEEAILEAMIRKYPEANFEHPDDCKGLVDIFSNMLKFGLEIKTCVIWKGATSPTWSNGARQNNNDVLENFLFISCKVEDGLVSIREAYYGKLAYNDFTHKKGKYKDGSPRITGMTIGIRKVRKLCERVI